MFHDTERNSARSFMTWSESLHQVSWLVVNLFANFHDTERNSAPAFMIWSESLHQVSWLVVNLFAGFNAESHKCSIIFKCIHKNLNPLLLKIRFPNEVVHEKTMNQKISCYRWGTLVKIYLSLKSGSQSETCSRVHHSEVTTSTTARKMPCIKISQSELTTKK